MQVTRIIDGERVPAYVGAKPRLRQSAVGVPTSPPTLHTEVKALEQAPGVQQGYWPRLLRRARQR